MLLLLLADAAADDLREIMVSCRELIDRMIALTEPKEAAVNVVQLKVGNES